MIIYVEPHADITQRLKQIYNNNRDCTFVTIKNISKYPELKTLPAIQIDGEIVAQGNSAVMRWIEVDGE